MGNLENLLTKKVMTPLPSNMGEVACKYKARNYENILQYSLFKLFPLSRVIPTKLGYASYK